MSTFLFFVWVWDINRERDREYVDAGVWKDKRQCQANSCFVFAVAFHMMNIANPALIV